MKEVGKQEGFPPFPNCQTCTWCLRDDNDEKWLCMYPFDDFGFESSRCPKDVWREKTKKTLPQLPLSKDDFVKVFRDFTVQERKEQGTCDEYTLSCYANQGEREALTLFSLLEKLGLKLVSKQKFEELLRALK